jgi:two-component system, OmpR family, response regulator VanR
MTDAGCDKLTLLYADDTESARHLYAEQLGQYFRQVYEAGDGREAWELYKRHRPDIILLDIEMPLLDGLEVAARIRENDKETRIIIATAYGDKNRLLQAVELGLTRFLPKPFGRKALKTALTKAVSERNEKRCVDLGAGYLWDQEHSGLRLKDRPVKLTPREHALLGLLASRPGQTFSFFAIELHLWPMDFAERDTDARLKTLVRRLRKKLPQGCIENVYGEGYKLNIGH